MVRFVFRRLFVLPLLVCALATAAEKIDRHALVTRHNPHITTVDPWGPLSVGNGQFCFTADVTGLQTFSDYYHAKGIGTETQARWSWHSNPNPNGYKLADANRPYTAYGKTQGYPTNDKIPAGQWLRENPHALPLPQLALSLRRANGRPLAPEDIHAIDQTLDLWTGTVTSRYTIDGVAVKAVVACLPDGDVLSIRLESTLLAKGVMGVSIQFPRGHDLKTKNNPRIDWTTPESHGTNVLAQDERSIAWEHSRDEAHYFSALSSVAPVAIERASPHAFRVSGTGEVLEFTLGFAPAPVGKLYDAAFVRTASAAHWEKFWSTGGAIDFSGSTDPRAAELERRVVLSQYLTAIQFAGDFPPSESGLTISTWYQKHHTEMIWWHTAHFALWGRDAFLAKNLDWFTRALPAAREIARGRDLRGARWPKMIGPEGRESPGGNPFIYWNQPHPIHLAELLYRNTPTAATLARYRDLVQETADCMASLLHWDDVRKCYNLGPPLWIAQEIYDQSTSVNPTYELSYWSRGLQIAQQWRQRQGLPRDAEWDKMIKAIAPLPVKDGKYVALESHPDTWENVASRHDHPSFLMALGQLPGDGVDRTIMANTLAAVLKTWDWETKIWGWDYPMIAMTAARLGEPKHAVDVLLKSDGPNNSYTANGHNKQRDDLPIYLPGNGSLLSAVAMMAVGWDGAPSHDAPGFPHDGSWVVRSEGLHPLP